MGKTDLHMHTTASDGDLSPEALVSLALQRGLTTIAITDHDSTEGSRAAAALGRITVIPAIELGAADEDQLIDVLGYELREDALLPDAPFQAWLAELRDDRFYRAQRMVQKLADIGKPIDFARVEEVAEGAPITRPHIARVLVEAGHADSLKDAFNRLIGQDGPAYVARRRLTPEEALVRLHEVGACAVLAHPARVKGYADVITRLIPAGLDGVEVSHPDNGEDVRLNLRGLAVRHDLLMTGGSDFHRPASDGTITLGAYNPPDGAADALRERAKRYR